MSSVMPVSYRRLFSGYGVYHQQVQFALIVRDRLYFRADEESRRLYIAKHMPAFLPQPARDSNFFQLPDEVLDNFAELHYWMRIAVKAAQQSYSLEDDEPAPQQQRQLSSTTRGKAR